MKKTTFYGSLAALLLILNMNFGGFYISPILENISSPLVSSLVSDILFFIPPALLYFAVSRTDASDIPKTLGFKDPGSKNIILILGMSIFIQPFLMFLSGISSLFYTNAASEYLETMFDMPALSMLTITSVAPAVFEELYFRGIVFSGFRRLNIVLACVLCGLLFGMAHLHPQQFLYAFFMGTIFSYFVYMTGSVFSSMLSHFVINSSQTILSVWANKITPVLASAETAVTFADFIPVLKLSIFCLIPFMFLMFFFHYDNINYVKRYRQEAVGKTKIITWPLVVIIGIFLFYCYSI